MNIHRSLGLAAALAISAGPTAAPAQPLSPDPGINKAIEFLQRLGLQYSVLFARTLVDLTYDSLSVDGKTQQTAVNGLTIRPRLVWDPDRRCVITADRVSGANSGDLSVLQSLIEVSGLSVPAECFDPGMGAMMQSFGYASLEVSSAAIDISYDMPTSGAQVLVSADLADAAEVTVDAEFEYVWVAVQNFGGEPGTEEVEPVAKLSTAEIAIENAGVWESLSPMLAAQLGDLSQLPQMIGPMLGSVLAQPGQPLGPDEQAFIDNVSAEVARFVRDGDRLVVSLNPEDGIWLSENILQTPQSAIQALKPKVSAAPLAADAILAPGLLAEAMAGGAGLSDDEKLFAGAALIDGIGAPRAPAAGRALIQPLADGWNPIAARLMAEASRDAGETVVAYEYALIAQAGSVPGAIGLADSLESSLSAEEVLGIQGAIGDAWPEANVFGAILAEADAAGDVSAIRRLASLAAAGRTMPRSYADAYGLASLAAAAGDRSAARLRDRIDARFTGADGSTNPAWADRRDEAAATALELWTAGGLADRVLQRYGKGG